ncbi:MAG TPA: FkbM family methyltransferase [Sphingomonas sp.]|nr:FkbM family methyltransferase [Sphingomonas sp.]
MSDSSVKLYQTRSGPMLALVTDQYVTQSIALYGEYCPAEANALKRAIKPGMTVVEVGANMGSHSVEMARACAPGRFYAFEPQPRLFQILCANLALNDVGNAFAYPDACGEAEGEAIVPLVDYTRAGNFGGISLRGAECPGITVRVRPLDSLNLPACGLLKVDVEGFEAQVIRGARDTILRCRPIIYIENDRADRQQELISLIAGLGYRLYWHTPALYDPANFNGEARNVFPGICSLNMVCLPREIGANVRGAQEIDPANWSSPIKLA